jgi:hypothetical protein
MNEMHMIRSLWWLVGDARQKWIDYQERTVRQKVAERRDRREAALKATGCSESYIARKLAHYDRLLQN